MCPRAKNFEYQTCSVNDLGLPAAFEVTLLYRAQHTVNDNQTDLVFADQFGEVFQGPVPKEAPRARPRNAGDLSTYDIEVDGSCETDCFFKSSFDGTSCYLSRSFAARRFQCRMDY